MNSGREPWVGVWVRPSASVLLSSSKENMMQPSVGTVEHSLQPSIPASQRREHCRVSWNRRVHVRTQGVTARKCQRPAPSRMDEKCSQRRWEGGEV